MERTCFECGGKLDGDAQEYQEYCEGCLSQMPDWTEDYADEDDWDEDHAPDVDLGEVGDRVRDLGLTTLILGCVVRTCAIR